MEDITQYRGSNTIQTFNVLNLFKIANDGKSLKTLCTCKQSNITIMIANFWNWYDIVYIQQND